MPSVPCMRLSDVSVICRVTVTYYHILIQFAFLPYLSARQDSGVLLNPISDIGRCLKVWYLPFLYGRTSQGTDFEFILTVKIETKHPVEGSFDSEFRAICNHCVVMAA